MARKRRRSRSKSSARRKPKVRAAPKARRKPAGRAARKGVWARRLGKGALIVAAGWVGLTVLAVLLYRVVDPPTTPLMWIRWAESGYLPEHPRWLRPWTPLERISPKLVHAVLTAEDQKFFQHHGFDWSAVRHAVRVNLETERRVGASTLSMQTARNVFLWQERTWLRKGLEAWFTVLIELLWSKERILEVYFNIVEWGDGIYGCEAASRTYFHHSADTVSPLESAWLAALLPNPRAWSSPEYAPRMRQRQHRILTRMAVFTPPARAAG